MLGDFVLFGDDFAYVGLVAAIASARHPCPALATELFIPSKIWFSQTHPMPKQMGQFLSIAKRYLCSLGVS
jgi:hypothetical protein